MTRQEFDAAFDKNYEQLRKSADAFGQTFNLDGEDALNDVYVYYVENETYEIFDADGPFVAFVLRLVWLLLLREKRDEQRHAATVAGKSMASGLDRLPAWTPQEIIEANALVESLPADDYALLVMLVQDGMSTRRIAKALKLPKTTLLRRVKKIFAQFGPKGGSQGSI